MTVAGGYLSRRIISTRRDDTAPCSRKHWNMYLLVSTWLSFIFTPKVSARVIDNSIGQSQLRSGEQVDQSSTRWECLGVVLDRVTKLPENKLGQRGEAWNQGKFKAWKVRVCGSPCITFHTLYLVMHLFSNNMKEVQLEEWESAQMCDVMWCDVMWCHQTLFSRTKTLWLFLETNPVQDTQKKLHSTERTEQNIHN